MNKNDMMPPQAPASHRHARVEVYDEWLDLEAAVARGLWGAWWASVALQEGVAAAAALPLHEPLEAEAQAMANAVTVNNPAAVANPFAIFPTVAEAAYRKAVALAREVRRTRAQSPHDVSAANDAVQLAENLGRIAAMLARVTLLSVRDAAQRATGEVQP